MTEEVSVPAVEPVAEQDTSAPAPTETAPVGSENEQPEEKATKTFTQEEMDAIIEKRLAKEQRKAARERERLIADVLARNQPAPKQEAPANDRPTPDKFTTTEEYVEAVAEWKAKEILKSQHQESETRSQQEASQRYMAEMQAEYQEREEAAAEKYDDFEEVTRNPALKITPPMAEAIIASDVGPDVAYYLGINPKEAERISKLSPFLQVKEIGRLEAKVMAEPPAKKTTSAPPPISPVKPKGSSPITDTLNPKSLETLGTSKWIELEQKRMLKKLEAERR